MKLPYDSQKLDRLMEEVGADLILATTNHNVRYLTGGYFYHFHDRFEAMGSGRYIATCGIPRGAPERAFLIGQAGETGQAKDQGLWIPDLILAERQPSESAKDTAAAIKKRGLEKARIAVEGDFLPANSMESLKAELPGASFAEAHSILEELRAIKTQEEIDLIRRITEADSETIQEVFQSASPGATTRDISRAVEEGMTRRGLHFLWVFTCAGNGMLRAPSKKVWETGEVLHIDAGGAENGYLTDVCRMGVRGKPSDLAQELFDACLSTQDAARAATRPGIATSALYDLAVRHLEDTGHGKYSTVTIHGIGMVSHEQPRFVPRNDRELEAGMVLSIETDIRHPEEGYVKIEDTVAVTEGGCEGLGDLGRETFAVVA